MRENRGAMIKAVFFDFYHTLGFWHTSLEASLEKIADRYECNIDWTRYPQARAALRADASASDPTNHLLAELLPEIVDGYREFVRAVGVKRYVEQFAWELLQAGHTLFAANAATLYDDVVPTLTTLQETGYKLAIVSNWDSPLDPLIQRLGITGYFESITASHDERVRSLKPDPHIFRYTLEKVGVTAENTVHVGDTYEADIIGAQNAGIRPILIDRAGEQAGRWHETIQRLSELPALLA